MPTTYSPDKFEHPASSISNAIISGDVLLSIKRSKHCWPILIISVKGDCIYFVLLLVRMC